MSMDKLKYNPNIEAQIVEEKIQKMASSIDYAKQAKQLNEIAQKAIAISESIPIEAIHKTMITALGPLLEFYKSPQMVEHTKNIAIALNKALEPLRQIDYSRFVELLLPRLNEIAKFINNIDYSWINQFDFSSLALKENGLDFGDNQFTFDELKVELDIEIEEVKKHKSLYESFEDFKEKSKRYWLIALLMILYQFYLGIPEFINATDDYIEYIPKLIALINEKTEKNIDIIVYVYTINEKTPLRESADGKAKKLTWLLIDTKLRVINDVPRWYEVEYIKEDGTIFIGWVSKRSIEIGEE